MKPRFALIIRAYRAPKLDYVLPLAEAERLWIAGKLRWLRGNRYVEVRG